MSNDHDHPPLTAREHDVVRLASCGYSAKQIALELAIAPRTVDSYLEHAKAKTGARNRNHLIAIAIGSGWVEPPIEPRDGGAEAAPSPDSVNRVRPSLPPSRR
ncbi:MAG: response regulator transcription factor [Sphingomonas sp.]